MDKAGRRAGRAGASAPKLSRSAAGRARISAPSAESSPPVRPPIASAVNDEVYLQLGSALGEVGPRPKLRALREVVHHHLAAARDYLIACKYVPPEAVDIRLSDDELVGLVGAGTRDRGVGPQKTAEMLTGRILGRSDDWYRRHLMGGAVEDRPGRRLQRHSLKPALLPPLLEPDPWVYAARLICTRPASEQPDEWRHFAAAWNRIMRFQPEARTARGQPIVMFCEWCGCQIPSDLAKPFCPLPADCYSDARAKERGRPKKKLKRP